MIPYPVAYPNLMSNVKDLFDSLRLHDTLLISAIGYRITEHSNPSVHLIRVRDAMDNLLS